MKWYHPLVVRNGRHVDGADGASCEVLDKEALSAGQRLGVAAVDGQRDAVVEFVVEQHRNVLQPLKQFSLLVSYLQLQCVLALLQLLGVL